MIVAEAAEFRDYVALRFEYVNLQRYPILDRKATFEVKECVCADGVCDLKLYSHEFIKFSEMETYNLVGTNYLLRLVEEEGTWKVQKGIAFTPFENEMMSFAEGMAPEKVEIYKRSAMPTDSHVNDSRVDGAKEITITTLLDKKTYLYNDLIRTVLQDRKALIDKESESTKSSDSKPVATLSNPFDTSRADRYETAIGISKATYDKAESAVIASGEQFPDALVGGTLAIQVKGPTLLVEKDGVPKGLVEELKRLEAKSVYLLGGMHTVSKKVEEILKKEVTVERIAGADRYETAEAVTKKRLALMGRGINGTDRMTYVSGTTFADALAAASFVARDNPSDGSANFLELVAPSDMVKKGWAFGGQAAVAGDTPNRIAGENRYGTASAIAERSLNMIDDIAKKLGMVVVVNGNNFPDGLAAAPLVASKDAVLLLTDKDMRPREVMDYLNKQEVDTAIFIGGEAVLSPRLEKMFLFTSDWREN